ncbi:MAG: hypothetical protein OIN66_05500 [Candidatus Methanoperedens sp.]|nr:hypothetical protein [Candidatus Methanoperedens sp.]
MEKEKYLKIAQETLSLVFSEASAKSTIEAMEKLRLSAMSDIDVNLTNELNAILYKRVRILKGENTAVLFLKSIKAECSESSGTNKQSGIRSL